MEVLTTIWENENHCFVMVWGDGTFSISDEYEMVDLSNKDMFEVFLKLKDYFSTTPADLADQNENHCLVEER